VVIIGRDLDETQKTASLVRSRQDAVRHVR